MYLPDIYYYNPTCDFAIANGTASWQPNRLLQGMEIDTGNLPQYLCRSRDIVLVRQLPSERLKQVLTDSGFNLPEFRLIHEATADPDFLRQPRGFIRPWGWSPAAHSVLDPFKPTCSAGFLKSPVAYWQERSRQLYSRLTARDILSDILQENELPELAGPGTIPVSCRTLSEIESLAEKQGRMMVKMPWSSSGRGLQPITTFPMSRSVRQRLSGMLRDQGFVLAERLLPKICDLGFLYEITAGEIRFLGHSRFFTSDKGQYRGNYLNGFPNMKSQELHEFIRYTGETIPRIHIRALEKSGIHKLYEGPCGIDTLIFRSPEGTLKIQPCLEINLRYTMGHLANRLEKHLADGSSGIFSIYYQKENSFTDYATSKYKAKPEMGSDGRIVSGFLPLTEFSRNNLFGAFLRVVPGQHPPIVVNDLDTTL
jgi:hypothetical protein